VPRILNPVVLVVDSLPKLCKDAQLEAYIKSLYGSVQACRWVSAAKPVTRDHTTAIAACCNPGCWRLAGLLRVGLLCDLLQESDPDRLLPPRV
jgi:hypothetical protein